MGSALITRMRAALAATLLPALAACADQAGLNVTGVAPTSGGPGTELTVTGAGFTARTSVKVCGLALEGLSLEVSEATVGVPGGVGTRPGAATLVGTVPDLGASAECEVVVTRGGSAPVTWSGTFSFQGAPSNRAPTTSGLPDLTIGADEAELVIDLAAAFDDADDGVQALSFAVALAGPESVVTATVNRDELTLGFPTRLGGEVDVTVTATDPHGASAESSFRVQVESGEVTFAFPGLLDQAEADVTVSVTAAGTPVASVRGDEVVALRPGSYRFDAELVVPGEYLAVSRTGWSSAEARSPEGAVVAIDLERVPGTGYMWVPYLGEQVGRGALFGFDDAALNGGPRTSSSLTMDQPESVVLGPDGALWVSGVQAVWRFDRAELAEPVPAHVTVIEYPHGAAFVDLVFDTAGNLWTAEYGSNRLSMFTPEQLAAGGSPTPALTIRESADLPLPKPIGLLLDGHGNLWVGTAGDRENRIYRFDADALAAPDPRPSLTVLVRGASSSPRVFDLALDDRGDLWFATASEYAGRVPAELLDAIGEAEVFVEDGTVLPIAGATALNFDSRGRLWALNRAGRLAILDGYRPGAPASGSLVLDLPLNVDVGGFVLLER